MKASKPLATMVAAATLMTPAIGLIAQSALADDQVATQAEVSGTVITPAKAAQGGLPYTNLSEDSLKVLAQVEAFAGAGGKSVFNRDQYLYTGMTPDANNNLVKVGGAGDFDAFGYTDGKGNHQSGYLKQCYQGGRSVSALDAHDTEVYSFTDGNGTAAYVFTSLTADEFNKTYGAQAAAPSDKTDQADPLEGLTAEERAYLTGVFKVMDAGAGDDSANIFDATRTLYTGLKGADGKLIDVKGNIPTEDALFSYVGVNGKTQTGHNTEWYRDGAAVTSSDAHDTEVLTFTGTKSGKSVRYVFTTLDHDPFAGQGADDKDDATTPATPAADDGTQAAPTADAQANQLADTGVGAASMLGLTAAVALAGSVMGLGALRRRD